MALFEVNLFSSVLNLQTEVWVTLPEKTPEGKLKVLWFMPGGHADASSWVRTARLNGWRLAAALQWSCRDVIIPAV